MHNVIDIADWCGIYQMSKPLIFLPSGKIWRCTFGSANESILFLVVHGSQSRENQQSATSSTAYKMQWVVPICSKKVFTSGAAAAIEASTCLHWQWLTLLRSIHLLKGQTDLQNEGSVMFHSSFLQVQWWHRFLQTPLKMLYSFLFIVLVEKDVGMLLVAGCICFNYALGNREIMIRMVLGPLGPTVISTCTKTSLAHVIITPHFD